MDDQRQRDQQHGTDEHGRKQLDAVKAPGAAQDKPYQSSTTLPELPDFIASKPSM